MKQEEKQARVQSEAPKLNSISSSTVARPEEKLTAEGLKPGERLEFRSHFLPKTSIGFCYDFVVFNVLIISRFKRLKEQEARLRQQREEEKGKAEESAKVESLTINDRDKSASVGVVVNGSLSRQEDVKEDRNSIPTTTMQRNDVDSEPSATQGEVNL